MAVPAGWPAARIFALPRAELGKQRTYLIDAKRAGITFVESAPYSCQEIFRHRPVLSTTSNEFQVDGPEAAKSAAFEATRSPSQTSMRQQGDQEQQSLAVALFEQVDRDGSGLISFDEFVDWWAQRQLSTGHALDKILAEKIQKQWNELDRDGSGYLDKN